TSKDCAKCHSDHNGVDFPLVHWQPSREAMDHRQTGFPLTGKHAPLRCEECHNAQEILPAGRTGIQVKDLNHTYLGLTRACTSCHADPHKGAFKGTCESCHNTSNWKQVAQLEGFDHSKTAYPLLGKHSSVACTECHNKGDFKTQVAYATCSDCHADYHTGQFLTRAGGGDCAVCHTVNGFKPSTFGVLEHAASMYPLEGRHAEVKCEQCHVSKGKDTLFNITHTQCIACHEDVHRGQFVAEPYQNRC